MIDIGANLTDPRFAPDLSAVLDRAASAGISHIIVTGTQLANSADAITLCRSRPGLLSCTVGIHPHVAARAPAGWADSLRDLAAAPAVRAIGETGLDFLRDFSPRDVQERVFATQLELAAELALPVFVHDRDSAGRVTQMLGAHRARLAGVVVHCFTGNSRALDALLALDCYIGITGWVCDERRGQELARLVTRIPADRLLLETDAPYLAPRSLEPRPRRNEPAFLAHIAVTVAALRDEDPTTVANTTSANARRLFRLPPLAG